MYKEAREYLNGITKYGSVLGLDSIRVLLRRLGNPQDTLRFVHVAGTNGKGSTVAFISTILELANYKTGRYVSPSVFSYREIIQINRVSITKEALTSLTFEIKEVIEEMLRDGFDHPTIFEVETALAFLYFKREKCDIVVLETGLGGVLDATNIVENTLAAVMTSISKDHMQFLGNTLKEITYNKVGIIKKDSVVVCTKQELEVFEVIKEQCKQNNNTLIIADDKKAVNICYKNLKIVFDYDEFNNIEIGLSGSCQIQNAILAIETAKALRSMEFKISDKAIEEGLHLTKWPGRFTQICKEPVIIIDGAHNEAAAIQLKETIAKHFKNKKLMFVIGVFADKEYEKMVEIMSPLAYKILTITTPDNPRALEGEKLAKVIEKYHNNVKFIPTLKEAAKECVNQKKSVDAIIAFGSLSYLGEFTKQVKALKGGSECDGR